MLRQDPDIILVGEIRDKETAENRRAGVADRPPGVHHAAHQRRPARSPVCSTWASSRSSSPPRWKASSPSAWCASICCNCKAEYTPTEEQLMELKLRPERRGGQEVLLRQGLRQLQQHRLPRPTGHLRDHDARRRNARHDHGQRIDQPAPRRRPRNAACARCAKRACWRSTTASRRSKRSSNRRSWRIDGEAAGKGKRETGNRCVACVTHCLPFGFASAFFVVRRGVLRAEAVGGAQPGRIGR